MVITLNGDKEGSKPVLVLATGEQVAENLRRREEKKAKILAKIENLGQDQATGKNCPFCGSEIVYSFRKRPEVSDPHNVRYGPLDTRGSNRSLGELGELYRSMRAGWRATLHCSKCQVVFYDLPKV